MKIKAVLLDYQEREYTSKRTGAPAIARELKVLTEDTAVLSFGYGNIDKDSDIDAVKHAEKGTDLTLDIRIEPDRYKRDAPRVVLNSVQTS